MAGDPPPFLYHSGAAPYPLPRIVKEHSPREYSLIIHDNGVAICDSQEGAFICLRFAEDVERLRDLLATIEIRRLPTSATSAQSDG